MVPYLVQKTYFTVRLARSCALRLALYTGAFRYGTVLPYGSKGDTLDPYRLSTSTRTYRTSHQGTTIHAATSCYHTIVMLIKREPQAIITKIVLVESRVLSNFFRYILYGMVPSTML